MNKPHDGISSDVARQIRKTRLIPPTTYREASVGEQALAPNPARDDPRLTPYLV